MTLLRKIIKKSLFIYARRVLFPWHKKGSFLRTWLSQTSVNIDSSVQFRVPVKIDGGGRVDIAEGVILGYELAPVVGSGMIALQPRTSEAVIEIGKNTATSNNVSMVCCQKITIGSNCRIGDMVSIVDADFHEINPSTRGNSAGVIAPVLIADNVWLGSRVMVLKGVSIGENSVIAAGAVVVKNIPPNVIAAGVPAKVIRSIV